MIREKLIAPRKRRQYYDDIDRIVNNIVEVDGCWVWQSSYGGTSPYGLVFRSFGGKNKSYLAHRYSYQTFVGNIPAGMQIDHLCENPSCVNPDHLEAVTPRVNTLRGASIATINALKTHCVRGHLLSEDNIYLRKQRGKVSGRICKICQLESVMKRYYKAHV